MGIWRSMRGAFILLEGLDRSGKSTQARMLVDALNDNNVPAKLYRFPDRNTTIGKLIDQYLTRKPDELDGDQQLPLRSLHLLFSANRWELATKLEQDIRSGVSVVVDRYALSGIAFSAAQGLEIDWCAHPDEGLPSPDVVFFMDISVEDARKRGGYGQEIYEREEMQLKVRLQSSYLSKALSVNLKTKDDQIISNQYRYLKNQHLLGFF
jgi:dTMP kinase